MNASSLFAELAKEEKLQLQAGRTYHLESPDDSHEAAQKLSVLLEQEKQYCISISTFRF